MKACGRLVDVFANRAKHPRSVFYLSGFGALSERECQIVSALMSAASIEVGAAVKDDEAVLLAQRILRLA